MITHSMSVIGGADGPTSIFIAGKSDRLSLKNRIRRYFYRKKRRRVEKTITAKPHTLEEVILYLQNIYGAVELSKDSRAYQEERKCLKESLILRHQPELLGDMAEISNPVEYDEESLKEFWKRMELRSRKAEEIPDELFPMDFHIYRITVPEAGEIHFSIELNHKIFGGSCSGSKKGMKKLRRMNEDICLYYGVTEEDIRDKTERYSVLVTVLCT